MPAVDAISVRPARWPADLAVATDLLQRYFAVLRGDPRLPSAIRDKDRAPELAALSRSYQAETSAFLLAFAGNRLCGCAAVHRLPGREHTAEMKRLFVLPEARGVGAARALVHTCAAWARGHGADELVLDTVPEAMAGAVRLYRSLGFEPTARYNENEGSCFAFYRLALVAWGTL